MWEMGRHGGGVRCLGLPCTYDSHLDGEEMLLFTPTTTTTIPTIHSGSCHLIYSPADPARQEP